MRAPSVHALARAAGKVMQRSATPSGEVFVKPIVLGISALLGSLVGCAGSVDDGSTVIDSVTSIAAAKHQRVNPDCTLVVPDNPLSAQGLATPYLLRATSRSQGICDEANAADAAFVQAAVLDPATGKLAVYNPLVISEGTTPAVAPVLPTLPPNAVVALWFGYNGSNLTLVGANSTTLAAANCVNGLPGDIFGQVAYCNAPAFFTAANSLRQAGKLTPAVPALGTALDGQPCPTVRDFAVVDQDPSDNVTSTYLVTLDGTLAQNTSANVAKLTGAVPMANASDNRLVAVALDGALGCKPYQAPDLADPGHLTTAQPLDELQAALDQRAPIALVPPADPMTLVNGAPDLGKQNLYRAGVNQPAEPSAAQAQTDEKTFCTNLLQVQPSRMKLDQKLTSAVRSPDPGAATNLFTFLAQRFNFTWGAQGLNCAQLIGKPSPITLQVDANGICTGATIATP